MPKVIYFLRGCPTEEQWEEARVMQAVFRNPEAVGREGDFFEDCEAVCGESIPEAYAHKPVLGCLVNQLKAAKNKESRANKPSGQTAGRPRSGRKVGE